MATVGTGSVVGAVALVMVLSAFANATVMTHPYSGTTVKFAYNSLGGCASGKATKAASFSLKTGSGGWAGVSSAKTPCGKFLGGLGRDSYSDVENGIDFAIPLKMHAGNTNVTANWALSGTGSTSIAMGAGACPTSTYSYVDPYNASYDYNITSGFCYLYASGFVQTYGYVEDLTNGSSYYLNWTNLAPCFVYTGYHYCDDPSIGNYSENYTDVYYYTYGPGSAQCSLGCVYSYNYSFGTAWTSTSTSVSISGYESFTANAYSYRSGWTFDPTHKYILFGEVYGYVDTEVYNIATGTAHASMSANPLSGGGWSLTSIVIS